MIDPSILKTLSNHGLVKREAGDGTILYDGHRPADYHEALTVELFDKVMQKVASAQFVRDPKMWYARIVVVDKMGRDHQGEGSGAPYHVAGILAAAKALRNI